MTVFTGRVTYNSNITILLQKNYILHLHQPIRNFYIANLSIIKHWLKKEKNCISVTFVLTVLVLIIQSCYPSIIHWAIKTQNIHQHRLRTHKQTNKRLNHKLMHDDLWYAFYFLHFSRNTWLTSWTNRNAPRVDPRVTSFPSRAPCSNALKS